MLFNPIEVMLHEHRVIQQVEHIIKKIDGLWNSKPDEYIAHTVLLISFCQEYVDEYHHRKEEVVLFPAIVNHPDFLSIELIDEFEQHHESFHSYMSDIAQALEADDYQHVQSEFKKYISDLLDHIVIEEEELFVITTKLLPDEDLRAIYFKFKDIDLALGEDNKTELEAKIGILYEQC